MSPALISVLKALSAISCLCILVVSEKLMVFPMGLIFVLGLMSVGQSDFSASGISILGVLSTGYLVLSAIIDHRKINYVLSTGSVTILNAIAVYTIINGSTFPTISVLSYLLFFSLSFAYFIGCLAGFRPGKEASTAVRRTH